MRETRKRKTIKDIFANPRYRGKHVILAGGRVFTAKTGEGASKILDEVMKKYPRESPEIAYLPRAQSLTF